MVTSVNSATSSTGTTSSSSSASTSASGVSSDFDTFLKMLTAQMQNQDPLNPIDSTDYATQLATFSGVEQSVKTNDLLAAISSQMSVMGMTQLAGWVGMDARAVAPGYFDGENPITVSPNPAVGSDKTVMVVTNAAGTEVDRVQIPATTDSYNWSGKDASGNPLPSGAYTFNLESYGSDKLLSTDQMEVYVPIVEAQGSTDGTILVLKSGAEVLSNNISALRDPTV
jgi:flagellar basal-body rod modification protein FlgD